MTRVEHFGNLAERAERVIADLQPLKSLDSNALRQVTGAHEWSIAMQLQHLMLSDANLLAALVQIDQAPPAADALPRKGLLPKFIVSAMSGGKRPPAPPKLVPANQSETPAEVAPYLEGLEKIRQACELGKSKRVESIRFRSPGGPFSLHLADGLEISVVHAEYHLNQIQEILKEIE